MLEQYFVYFLEPVLRVSRSANKPVLGKAATKQEFEPIRPKQKKKGTT